MIIDLHAHLGEDVVFDEEQTEEELITAYQENHVGGAIVQPYLPRIYMEDHRQIHDRIHRLCQESKEVKFWGNGVYQSWSLGQKTMTKKRSVVFRNWDLWESRSRPSAMQRIRLPKTVCTCGKYAVISKCR